jgi:putative FmdB family regulatory protein
MPTYEYACAACGHEWEQLQRITEPPVKTCPKCAASEAHRLISGGTNFILKGGGWYSDLYASPKSAKKTDGEGQTSAATGKDDGKSATPASSAEASPKADSKASPSTPGATPAPSAPPSSS